MNHGISKTIPCIHGLEDSTWERPHSPQCNPNQNPSKTSFLKQLVHYESHIQRILDEQNNSEGVEQF
jgi:hypothetical protein